MAVKIRMTRTGARNDVCYRVIATDSLSPRDGRFLEILGWYDPKKEGLNFNLKMDRVEHWIEKGAQVSDTVKSLIKKVDSSPEVESTPVPEAAAPTAEEEPVEEVVPEAEPAG